MSYNIIKLFLVFMISLGASPIGKSQYLKDTIPVDSNKKIIIVTKDNLQSKLDSIRAARKDSADKYLKKTEIVEKKIDHQLKSINKVSQKKKVSTSQRKKSVVLKSTPQIVSHTDSVITANPDTTKVKKKTFLQKINPFYKSKKHVKEN